MSIGGVALAASSRTCAPDCARLCTTDGFAEAYAAYTPALLARAQRLVGDPQQAEELIQETYLKAWRACASFQGSTGNLRAWLFTICRNLAIDATRTKAARPHIVHPLAHRHETTDLPLAEPADPVDQLAQWLTRHQLTEAMARLSDQHREILAEAFIHDRPYGEISRRLGIPAGTVKSRVFHALRALRNELDRP
jgi:RNA polymerase sigma-70 factor, ECF subfamily